MDNPIQKSLPNQPLQQIVNKQNISHKSKFNLLAIISALILIGGVIYALGIKNVLKHPPVLSSITPSSGQIGTKIILKGNNFTDSNYIKLQSSLAYGYITSVPSINNSTINFTIPNEVTFGCSIPPFDKKNSVTCNLIGSTEIKPGAYKVSVENINGKSNEVNLGVINKNQTIDTSNWKTTQKTLNDGTVISFKHPSDWSDDLKYCPTRSEIQGGLSANCISSAFYDSNAKDLISEYSSGKSITVDGEKAIRQIDNSAQGKAASGLEVYKVLVFDSKKSPILH